MNPNPLVIVLEGEPVPCARVRVTAGRATTPRTTIEFKSRVARAAKAAMHATGWHTCVEAVGVELVFGMRDPRKSDVDNLAKGVLDALTAAQVWADDRLVFSMQVEKDASFAPSTRVIVTDLGGGC